MKRVFASSSLIDASHVRNVLEIGGIRCVIKNEVLGGALGEIPFLDCQPEVWVVDDAAAARARRLIEESLRDDAQALAGDTWRCAPCGALNEPQFAACYRCGSADSEAP